MTVIVSFKLENIILESAKSMSKTQQSIVSDFKHFQAPSSIKQTFKSKDQVWQKLFSTSSNILEKVIITSKNKKNSDNKQIVKKQYLSLKKSALYQEQLMIRFALGKVRQIIDQQDQLIQTKERNLLIDCFKKIIQLCRSSDYSAIEKKQIILNNKQQNIRSSFEQNLQKFLTKQNFQQMNVENLVYLIFSPHDLVRLLFKSQISQTQVGSNMTIKDLKKALHDTLGNWMGQTVQIAHKHHYHSKKIIKLKVQYQSLNELIQIYGKQQSKSDKRLNRVEILYKTTLIRMEDKRQIQILESNQQDYVYFRINSQVETRVHKLTKMSRLFHKNNRADIYESQESSNDSEDSQIVMDDEFYRISSKISNFSNMKSSFNSGQRIILEGTQQNIETIPQKAKKNHLLDSTNGGFSQNRLKNPYDDCCSKSSSLQKAENNNIQRSLLSSMDFFMKLSNEGGKYERKQSCQNPRLINPNFLELANEEQKRVSNNIKVNLYNETNANLYSKDFNLLSKINPFDHCFMDETLSIESKKKLIRSFFKPEQEPNEKDN